MKSNRMKSTNRWLLGGAGLTFSFSVVAADIETDDFAIELVPDYLTTSSIVSLQLERLSQRCTLIQTNSIRIDAAAKTLDISLNFVPFDFAAPCISPDVVTKTVGALDSEVTYQVSVFREDSAAGEFFSDENLLGSFSVTPARASNQAYPEVPQEGSIQSGVGVIRGWACDANIVEVQIDDLPRLRLAYGSSRADTLEVCGDENNGYGVAIAWGLFGEGMHRMKTFIDGRERSDVAFEVVGLDEPFIEGLSGSYELGSFPVAGQSVVVRWSEADQNFIIVNHQR